MIDGKIQNGCYILFVCKVGTLIVVSRIKSPKELRLIN